MTTRLAVVVRRVTAAVPWRLVAEVCACVAAVATLSPQLPAAAQRLVSELERDERVIFFPSLAVPNGRGSWTAHVHGWIFEEAFDFGATGALKQLIGQQFGLDDSELDASQNFKDRARLFTVDNKERQLVISLSGRQFALERSAEDGHVRGEIDIPAASATPNEWLEFQLQTPQGDARTITGALRFVDGAGVSVVSDIDDTIKDSNVLNRRELAANTFLRDFRAVPGMAALYKRWANDRRAVFHYVSGSPWQLYPPLGAFLAADGFPRGTFHLRNFRLKDKSAIEFLENQTLEFKTGVIERLMQLTPARRFVLVGDSGEKDPEVYASVAARSPDRVIAIFIRDVRGEHLKSSRFVQLFSSLPARIDRRVFRDVAELADVTLPE